MALAPSGIIKRRDRGRKHRNRRPDTYAFLRLQALGPSLLPVGNPGRAGFHKEEIDKSHRRFGEISPDASFRLSVRADRWGARPGPAGSDISLARTYRQNGLASRPAPLLPGRQKSFSRVLFALMGATAARDNPDNPFVRDRSGVLEEGI